uniref:RGH1 n=1 Tax=Hordeum vulgare subsp. spontaneum TaxID=77009 RepID=A0A3G2KWS5_HORVS|nr:RGH1 [Hordeum vulgare subsp. spontaneum]
MNIVTGAMGSLVPKLGHLLMFEYNLHKRTKKDINHLLKELESMKVALVRISEVPRDQLDRQVKVWADEVRELCYIIEDVIDKFVVQVNGTQCGDKTSKLKGLMKNMIGLLKKGKDKHGIAHTINDIKKQLQEVAARCDRTKLDGVASNPTEAVAINPEATELVGIYGKRDQDIMSLLSLETNGDASNKRLKKVSIVGFGGLGKTTLARAVYEKIKGDFDCRAFVSVGWKADSKQVLRDILIDFGSSNSDLAILDERHLIHKLHKFIQNKRYLVIIDDIWGQNLCKVINLAIRPSNDLGSRLITTTRIFSVSQSCCPSIDDSVYQMKPLSIDDSRRLFYKRIFPNDCGCPNEFEHVSKDILKKCGGVPLAIISVASALAGGQKVKPKREWDILLQSLGSGLSKDNSLEEMRRILSFSYYDLPFHLKTCLLYLCIYPEDRLIRRDELVWKWVAEGFVCSEQGISQFLLGLSYFNELINRSMIQPIYDRIGQVYACRVYDMVLDLICNLSREAKFVNLLDGTGSGNSISSQNNVYRLSLQNKNEDHQPKPLTDIMSMSQVRSITIFPPAINILPSLSRFEVLRVLDLKGCNLKESSSLQLKLKDVGHLIHLRYLGLACTGIRELPAEIGNLQFLQVLDLGDNGGLSGVELPVTVNKLSRLICLHVDTCEVVPGVLQNFTYMEVLKIQTSQNIIVQELGNLSRLRELEIGFKDGSLDLYKAFVKSLRNLHHIESLLIDCYSETSVEMMDLLGERWVPPIHLRKFKSYMPSHSLQWWIKKYPSHLSNLSELRLKVKEVYQEDVEIIGGLMALRGLWIKSTHQTERLLVIRADGFRRMVVFDLDCGSAAQIMFEPRALPRAEAVRFSLSVRVAKEDGNCGFDLGLQGNLPSLRRRVWVHMYCGGVSVGEAKEAEAAVRRALEAHPSHPPIYIDSVPHIAEDAHDDDLM